LSAADRDAASPTAGMDLVEMATSYVRSRIVCAAARLRVADALEGGAQTINDLAIACGADPSALYRLMRTLASIGIVTESAPGSFSLTPFGRPLRKDAPDSVWPTVVFWGEFLADNWVHLTNCVRTGKPAKYIMERDGVPSRWANDPDAGAIFRAVMGNAPTQNYKPLVDSWNFAQAHVVADLGGGGGSMILAILKAVPHLKGMLVDRQASIDAAAPRVNAEGMASRCQLIAADLLEAVPPGADVYLLSAVLHGYEDERALQILTNCRSVMTPASRLLLIEFVLPSIVNRPDPELERRLVSDLNMLAVTGGKERSEHEWKQLLERSGLTLRQVVSISADPDRSSPFGQPSVVEVLVGNASDDKS
jgi:O-methyltransferase domain/Dimerisation domain